MTTLRRDVFDPVLCALCLAMGSAGEASAGPSAPAVPPVLPVGFELAVDQPGVYRVSFEDLAAAGPVPESGWPTAQLAMTNLSNEVPLWIEDGGDGWFGPGDAFELVGQQLAGDGTYYSQYSRWNAYRLWLDRSADGRRPALSAVRAKARPEPAPAGETRRHFEQQELRVRFNERGQERQAEAWFWHKLTHVDKEPFRLVIDLGDREAASPLRLRVALRGWSQSAAVRQAASGDAVVESEHQVTVSWNGEVVTSSGWNGQEAHVVEVELTPDRLGAASNELSLQIPRRASDTPETPRIDVSLVDWVDVVYQARAASAERPRQVLRPPSITVDWPSNLEERKADYLMIVHQKLREAIEPLAAFHRERGLVVEVIDVEDIFDQWSEAVTDPRAIRNFIAHAKASWSSPAPRFVLLVGDASWDPYHSRGDDGRYADWTYRPGEQQVFIKNSSTPYREDQALDRNLVPTFEVTTVEGAAASDNAFVAVEGDDVLPDLAIGRFPVTEPADVAAIVAKTLRYAATNEDLAWRRRILWITSDEVGMQRRSDGLATDMEARGFLSHKVYPAPEETDNSKHQASLLEAFGEGNLLVHFFGHGGRYIWRTGPPDLRKNHDLFTLEHLDQLTPTSHLPVVLSMTCYSAPFDHPTADSIGEKLLRLPESGAVAVIAASWRNSPSIHLSKSILDELTKPGATVGEALMVAKRAGHSQLNIETYNLLGDPALVLATVRYSNTIKWVTASEVDNFGYDVFRGDSEEGPFSRINPDPVLGAGTTDEPQSYRYVDDTINPTRAYWYYVESVSLAGERERFTPIFRAKPKLELSPPAAAVPEPAKPADGQ